VEAEADVQGVYMGGVTTLASNSGYLSKYYDSITGWSQGGVHEELHHKRHKLRLAYTTPICSYLHPSNHGID
jgi:hypothetical protein